MVGEGRWRWGWLRVPLKVQIGLVVALFLAALLALWSTWASVVVREGRRSSTRAVLDRGGADLAVRGTRTLADAPRWPYAISQHDWDELDRGLAREADAALRPLEGVAGGYYLRDFRKFLGTSQPVEPGEPAIKVKAKVKAKPAPKPKKGRPRPALGPPPREAGLIENQVEAAIESGQVLFIVQDVPPSTVAIRTAPVVVEGRTVAATWTMVRLIDPLFLDRSIRGYRLAAGLALGGIALALVLLAGLARTIRHQAGERVRLQAELRRSERLAALGKLLAGVAHEVRNPLAGIRSTVQLWQRGIGPDEESIDGLHAEVDRIEAIVARLLHFSRADAQDLAPGDLNNVLAEAARLARSAADSRGVKLELALDPELPPVVLSPPALLQVFRNLTSNALQAMPQGGVIRLATRRGARAGTVEASVTDTGPGLAPDLLAHLFEPFYTTKPEGTGLGLAIAREIVLAHQGELRAENTGHGAQFWLVLPVAGAEAMAKPAVQGVGVSDDDVL
jgi:signal transduction histidine kinase